MCGIIGEYSNNIDNLSAFVSRRDLLQHRGPDAAGIFISEDKKLKLGHQRLSILDLSQMANQPIEIDNHVIVYNGEVYNFQDLKKEHQLDCKTSSDTEVVLKMFIKYGTEAFAMFDGMFALTIFDKANQRLILARDRIGIKPLYYYHNQEAFFFASEIQSLFIDKEINYNSLAKFIQQNYIYGNETILQNVYKLAPAHFAIYDLSTKQLSLQKYWQASFEVKYNRLQTAEKELYDVLKHSVKQSMISDVPLGVFLSSGNDSSLITALAKEHTSQLDTFTVGFEFSSFDESKKAAKIAEILGTNHHEIFLNKEEIIENIPKILDQFHEPFGDNSAIPVYFMSKFARQTVKVCLSGDGADELFGGYPLYYLPKISGFYRFLPGKKLIEGIVNHLPSSYNKLSLDYKLKRFVRGAKFSLTKAHFYYRMMHNTGVISAKLLANISDDFSEYGKEVKNEAALNQLLYIDQKTILEGDYLVKVDRMSMANHLEVRVPFLNSKVIDLANSLPTDFKVKGFTTKVILKKILERYLPKELVYSSKQGFSFPIGAWLKHELKDFMYDVLSRENVGKLEFLDYKVIEQMIKDHNLGHKDYNRELWGLISLVNYCNKNFTN